jgi:hypothetical protein
MRDKAESESAKLTAYIHLLPQLRIMEPHLHSPNTYSFLDV